MLLAALYCVSTISSAYSSTGMIQWDDLLRSESIADPIQCCDYWK
jgi:hypothetical protein